MPKALIHAVEKNMDMDVQELFNAQMCINGRFSKINGTPVYLSIMEV